MRSGLTISAVMHAALLAFGLVSLSAPRNFDSGSAEALPVDIVPMEEVAQAVQGDKKAPMNEKPAPTPTTKPDDKPDAQKLGDNSTDTDNPITDSPKESPVKTQQSAAKAPDPKEKIDTEDTPKPKEEPAIPPATEVAPEPTPKQEVTPDPVKEPQPSPEETAALPDAAPAPLPDPRPAEEAAQKEAAAKAEAEAQEKLEQEAAATQAKKQAEEKAAKEAKAAKEKAAAEAKSAKAPDRKDTKKPVKEATSKKKSNDDSLEDDIAALLTKEKSKGGGAKRSSNEASLGSKQTTGVKLSNSEESALSSQLQGCWSIPAGLQDAEGMRATVDFDIDASGKLQGRPVISTSSGNAAFDRSVITAVRKCDQQGLNLPASKMEQLATEGFSINFDPTEMF